MSDKVINFSFDRSKWTAHNVEKLTPNAKVSLLVFVENAGNKALNYQGWAKLAGINKNELKNGVYELVSKGFLIKDKDTKKGLTSRADKLGQLKR